MERQRTAARIQAGARVEAADSFFLVPFTSPAPAVPALAPPVSCTPAAKEEIAKWIAEAARKEGVAQNLVEAVVETESGYDSCAVSPKGAEGLMQLMPSVQEEMDVVDPFDARQNLFAGARHLKKLLELYKGDLKRALSAYNAGPARVQDAGGIPDIQETQEYVARILAKVKPDTAKPPAVAVPGVSRPPSRQ